MRCGDGVGDAREMARPCTCIDRRGFLYRAALRPDARRKRGNFCRDFLWELSYRSNRNTQRAADLVRRARCRKECCCCTKEGLGPGFLFSVIFPEKKDTYEL